jgi:hypothetical protein
LSVGVFGTLVMHSPKVPHPDFSVKVMRHNGRIYFCGKLLIRETRKVDKALLLGKARAKSHGVRIWEVPPFANNAKGWGTRPSS